MGDLRRLRSPADLNARGISVRLEAIDALETHSQETRQELAGANARPVGAGRQRLTNRSRPHCTRFPQPRAVTAIYFAARPRVDAHNGLDGPQESGWPRRRASTSAGTQGTRAAGRTNRRYAAGTAAATSARYVAAAER
jgi:hypothetical protein